MTAPFPCIVSNERELMQLAIELAAKCVSEKGKVSPKVGAVVVRDGGNTPANSSDSVTTQPT